MGMCLFSLFALKNGNAEELIEKKAEITKVKALEEAVCVLAAFNTLQQPSPHNNRREQ